MGIDETGNEGEGARFENSQRGPDQDDKVFHATHPSNPPVACKSTKTGLLGTRNVITM